MGRLGDFFPEHERQEYAGRHLRPGQVLYLFCGFTNPPKDKYLVLAHPGARSLVFVVNSQIHPFIANRGHLLGCQVRLNDSEYDFLDHDSYVNCSEVIDYLTDREIREQISADVSRVKGELSASTKRKIVRVVQEAKTISPRHKRLIVDSLK